MVHKKNQKASNTQNLHPFVQKEKSNNSRRTDKGMGGGAMAVGEGKAAQCGHK